MYNLGWVCVKFSQLELNLSWAYVKVQTIQSWPKTNSNPFNIFIIIIMFITLYLIFLYIYIYIYLFIYLFLSSNFILFWYKYIQKGFLIVTLDEFWILQLNQPGVEFNQLKFNPNIKKWVWVEIKLIVS